VPGEGYVKHWEVIFLLGGLGFCCFVILEHGFFDGINGIFGILVLFGLFHFGCFYYLPGADKMVLVLLYSKNYFQFNFRLCLSPFFNTFFNYSSLNPVILSKILLPYAFCLFSFF